MQIVQQLQEIEQDLQSSLLIHYQQFLEHLMLALEVLRSYQVRQLQTQQHHGHLQQQELQQLVIQDLLPELAQEHLL